MKTTVTTVYEGTLEEILAALPHLQSIAATGSERIEILQSAHEAEDEDEDWLGEAEAEDEEISYVPTPVARRVMSRIKLQDIQKNVLVAIYHAHPGTMLASQLQEQIGYTPAQFAGLMGAWGRRLSHTPGYDGEYFFIQEWNEDAHCYEYELPESVREAMRLENLV